MVFDTHAHIFPEKISQAAVKGISDFYDVPCFGKGTVDHLLNEGKKAGIHRFLVHSVATVPHQVESINQFIARECNEFPDKLIGFMTMHPDFENIEQEIERARKDGLSGIKLHPDQQHFAIDDQKAYAIYEVAEGNLPILFHMGDPRYAYSNPHRLVQVMKDFPKLKVIGAHFAGWSEWDEAAKCLAGKENLWVDCSSSSFKLSKEEFKEKIYQFGTERVFFASDYPMWSPDESLRYLQSLDLPEKDLDNILWNNAAAFFQV